MTGSLLIARHKWGEDIYVAANTEEFYEHALGLLRERIDQGFWYDNWNDGDPAHQWEDRAHMIANDNDGKKAWDFLEERRDFEYEWVEEGYSR